MTVTLIMVCVQCAMRDILAGQTPEWITDTPEEHMRKVHPDPIRTKLEREELDRRLRARWELGDR